MIDALLNPDEPRVRHEPDPDEQLDAMREQSMSAPYGVQVVFRDGVARYLRADGMATDWSYDAQRFTTVDAAQDALDGLRRRWSDPIMAVVNLDDPEARVEQ